MQPEKQHDREKTSPARGRFFDRTLGLALLAVGLYGLALPPVGFWPLVFLPPLIWARLIRSDTFPTSRFRYRKLYFSGLLFWLVNTFWVCFPHPLTSLGWIALSGYLACYLPLFVGVSRRLVSRFNLPAFLVAPVVWVGCEWFRKHLFGGMSLGGLEHTFFRQPELIQLADLGGEYTVGMWVVLLGCCCEQAIWPGPRQAPSGRRPRFGSRRVAVLLGILALAANLLYGQFRLREQGTTSDADPIRIAVLQGNYPVMLDPPEDWWEKTFEQYVDLSEQAVEATKNEDKPLDLIVWPETVFPYPLFEFEAGFESDARPRVFLDQQTREFREKPLEWAKKWDTPLLLGLPTYHYEAKDRDSEEPSPLRFNSAVLADPKTDTLSSCYNKVHLVMFGEYVPFAEYLPDSFPLKTLCQTAARGSGFVAMPIPGRWKTEQGNRSPIYIATNICFEGFVPQLIRRQVRELAKEGKEPDILVNLSNVGWFYFTSEIDLQFAAQVFRAVEHRKPYLTAANAGFSGSIDSNGRILKQGKRREATFLIADVRLDTRKTMYTRFGDWLTNGCLLLVAVLFVFSCFAPPGTGKP